MPRGTTFMNRQNRDEAFRAAGGRKAGYLKRTMRNQLMHPQYIDDYEQETGAKLTSADKGFGNGIYKTTFSVIYLLCRKADLTATEKRAGEEAEAAQLPGPGERMPDGSFPEKRCAM